MQSPKQEDKKARFSGRFWLMLFAGALLLTYLIPKIFGDEQAATIPYSEFKALLRDQKITRCTITSDEISGYFRADSTTAPPTGFLRKFLARDEAKPGETAFLTVPINDPDLIKDLEAAGVAYAGAASDGWWQDMLFMFAATLLFLVFIFFLMSALSRRFNPQRGLMSIG
ncbi:ATP-dependent metallopeptidase FtsH/Yme1/Tma family protein, partial [candidate division KSB1 bacterium]|nr:ATP-dependent metallopeptidase FtsH/Yme1/Tma family protein [candidate division KSB1 bacterium]